MTTGTCPACDRPRKIFSRGICRRCYMSPLVRRKWPKKQNQRYWTVKEIIQLRACRWAGYSDAETAAKLGRSKWSVRDTAQRHGFRSRVRGLRGAAKQRVKAKRYET